MKRGLHSGAQPGLHAGSAWGAGQLLRPGAAPGICSEWVWVQPVLPGDASGLPMAVTVYLQAREPILEALTQQLFLSL